MKSDHTQLFLQVFNDTARYHHRYEVFRDFVTMAGLAIQNTFLKSESIEQEYLSIVKRYEGPDVIQMSHLLALVVQGLEVEHRDLLGNLYMQLDFGSQHIGQFFTPYDVSRMMAKMLMTDRCRELEQRGYIRLSEPACGAGGMAIAFAEAMLEQGLNPQRQLWVSCIDLDPVAAMMCYIQLSLLGIPAEVIIGNALSMQTTRTLYTPMYYLDYWALKGQVVE
jgi:Type I restriction-modification system methyltransferase subunit